ncbi:MAG: UvrB/UvrC motif-containing protein, partial [Acholeplasmataceae bacterium]|nr:UvrB/UvrC motif-containing protein [Acholeplasmataceae bacterium]
VQDSFNQKYHLEPVTVKKDIRDDISIKIYGEDDNATKKKYTPKELKNQISEVERLMKNAAKELDFEKAAELRDLLFELKASI